METHCWLTQSAELRVAVLRRSEISAGSCSLGKHHCWVVWPFGAGTGTSLSGYEDV